MTDVNEQNCIFVQLFNVLDFYLTIASHVTNHVLLDTPTEDGVSRQLLRELEGAAGQWAG